MESDTGRFRFNNNTPKLTVAEANDVRLLKENRFKEKRPQQEQFMEKFRFHWTFPEFVTSKQPSGN